MLKLLSSGRPALIDMAQVYRQSNQENLEQAFGVAERELGVTRLLDPEGESSLLRYWLPMSLLPDCCPASLSDLTVNSAVGIKSNPIDWLVILKLMSLLFKDYFVL